MNSLKNQLLCDWGEDSITCYQADIYNGYYSKWNLETVNSLEKKSCEYAKSDAKRTKEMYDHMKNMITKVVFNDPATIVFWGRRN